MRYAAILILVIALLSGSFVIAATAERPKEDKIFKAAVDADGVQRVEMVGGSYFFSPSHIVVKVNVPVELKVRKEPGIVPHDIVMKAPDAGIDFNVTIHEDPQVIRFTPTRAGIYHFYCDKKLLFFESHREKGMEGTLEVVE
jgi:plastocyanin domain-containing protein